MPGPIRLLLPLLILSCTCLLAPQRLSAQQFDQKDYPQGYYLFPLQPGSPALLAGTLGEIRGNHFHAGIDIKTGNREGLPVLAAADGYIYRIYIDPNGYGKAVFIKHPNGQKTVYGHLQRFSPALQRYVVDHQYRKRDFKQDIFFDSLTFRVKRGETIAFSGNSGGSAAPHLHFEVRDASDAPLNPVFFGFKELSDGLPPVLQRFALRPLDIHARVEGHFARKEFNVQRVGPGRYRYPTPIRAFGDLGLEVSAYDVAEGTTNKYGINFAEVLVAGKKVYSHAIERLPYSSNRCMHVFTDYEQWRRKGQKFQRLYRHDGNDMPIFLRPELKGRIALREGRELPVVVRLTDSFGNTTELELTLQPDFGAPQVGEHPVHVPPHRLEENVLVVNMPGQRAGEPLQLHTPLGVRTLSPAYRAGGTNVYLWDLRKGLPLLAEAGGKRLLLPYRWSLPPRQSKTVRNGKTSLQLHPQSLLDTLYLSLQQKRDTLRICHPFVPLREHIEVRYRPGKHGQVYLLPEYGGKEFVGGQAEKGGYMRFQTKQLGAFAIYDDLLPPSIAEWKANKGHLRFRISDNLSGIKSYKATLDGKWILLDYDAKRNLLETSPWDHRLPPLRGRLLLIVEDKAGNKASFEKHYR